MSDPIDFTADFTAGPEESPFDKLPPWHDRTRIYRAIHTRQGRILDLCFIPNNGTHNRYLPRPDLRLYDCAKDGTELILEFSAMTVVITGRYLSRAADDIAINRCAALEAFDAKRRDMPDDPVVPFIEKIAFLLPQRQRADTAQQGRLGVQKQPKAA